MIRAGRQQVTSSFPENENAIFSASTFDSPYHSSGANESSSTRGTPPTEGPVAASDPTSTKRLLPAFTIASQT